MDKYTLSCFDNPFCRPKNLQKIGSIEIYFSVTKNDNFIIKYQFHSIDFKMWLEILKIHMDNVDNAFIYDENMKIYEIDDLLNNKEYYNFSLVSKDFNLYRNIHLIMFLEKDEWDNMNDMLRKNTWKD